MKISQAFEDYLIGSKLADEEAHEAKRKKRKFYVSDMGKCHRMRFLKRKGINQEFSPHVYWILKIGEMYHDLVYNALESKGLLLESEDYVSNQHFVGRFDGIVKGEEKGKKDVLSIKSAGSYPFQKVLKGQLSDENVAQMMTEIYLLQKEKKLDIDTGLILYVNKEPSDKLPHISYQTERLRLTNWRKEKIKEEMDIMVDYWINDKIPSCTCPAWMKPYNSFQPLCQAPDDEVSKILNYVDAGKTVITNKKELIMIDGKKRKELIKL